MCWPYAIDWSATGAWMQAWAGFAGVGAVIWAALRGQSAFATWLQQKQTERRLDVAEKLLFLVYKAEDVFTGIRSPFSLPEEVQRAREVLQRAFSDGVPDLRRHNLEIAQTILNRVNDHGDFWSEYRSLRPQVRAYFGQGYADTYAKIWTARGKIVAAASSYGRINPSTEERNWEQAGIRRDRLEAIFWDGWADAADQSDEIKDLISATIAATETVVQPLLATSPSPPT